jgi:hypothetical protein
MIVKTNFVKGDPAAAQTRLVAYLKDVEEHQRRTENQSHDDHQIFTKDEDRVTHSAAVQDVMKHAHRQVAYHEIVLSPGEDEPITDWRKWTRGVMDDLEKKKGRKLHWYAVTYDNTEAMMTTRSSAGAREYVETGNREAVRMDLSDYALLRQSGIDRSDRDCSRQKASHVSEVEDHPSS